jgi:hypothetical protein
MPKKKIFNSLIPVKNPLFLSKDGRGAYLLEYDSRNVAAQRCILSEGES